MKCYCGREAFYYQKSSGEYLCKKHLIKRLERKVAKEASSLGLLRCEEITITKNEYNFREAILVYNSLKSRAKRRSCPEPKLVEGKGDLTPLSAEKVLYLLLKAFYLGEVSEFLHPKEAGNPAYVILPRDLAAYSYAIGLREVPKPFGEGPLWDVAVKIATEQPTETYSSFKLIDEVIKFWKAP
ncbi:hypothetical protein EYM_05650 [Ignicoccus islandicus DSM 13165]|uniref:2-thiouridine synthetase TtuA-like N-terminal LIM domain-containing protein n=1 Tax=Ignicoccus islandicus DSM 13165 TaxID=940295 RepID=A0A0U3EBA6_9CREN|nr:hypothetical protein [Ignicoccus islandicus]ALU12606.1 hypothetical protein EYM_05650 [Ignicoccus islandicus DSM 13165]